MSPNVRTERRVKGRPERPLYVGYPMLIREPIAYHRKRPNIVSECGRSVEHASLRERIARRIGRGLRVNPLATESSQ
jgi:hypothetical protein